MTSREGSQKAEETEVMIFLSQWPLVLSELHALRKQLQRRSLLHSFPVAHAMALFLRKVVGTCAFKDVEQAMATLRVVGRRLQKASPFELAVGNIVRRVLKVFRDISVPTDDTAQRADLTSLLSHTSAAMPAVPFRKIKADVLETINDEIIAELEGLHNDINAEAGEYIHDGEVILTFGDSLTVKSFLLAAKKKRDFDVIVAEAAPRFSGRGMARDLAEKEIDTTLITDSAIFAMMARVDKVIVGAHIIMANGGLIGEAGLHTLALAAKHHAVPLVCVAGLFKLSPEYPFDQNTVNNLLSPSSVLSFQDMGETNIGSAAQVNVLNPAFDYVPPDLVNLFLTNVQGCQPSYMYRLLSEYYHRDDYVL